MGNFNPSIFNPFWLSSKGFFTEEQGEKSEIEIINPHLSKFKIVWAEFEITDNRAQIRTTDGTSFESSKDIALGLFKILNETPLNALGLNLIHHYQIKSKQQYIEFGNILAPFSNWKDILNNPKMLRLEMIQEERDDGYTGSKRVRITPSNLINPSGIRIDVNNHFELKSYGDIDEKLQVLSKNWEPTLRFVDEVMKHILRKTGIWR